MKLHLFNPENDLALACGNSNYCPPPSAQAIAVNLATLPLWFAPHCDLVFCDNEVCRAYHKEKSAIFSLPQLFDGSKTAAVDGCSPWGWSAMMRRRFKDIGVCEDFLPSKENVERLRELSNRRSVITFMDKMRDAGIDVPSSPLYLASLDDVACFVNSVPRSVLKAPWSGSGKGIAWGIGRMELPVEHFCKGIIRRQGGVLCERYLDKVVDFAMEFKATLNGVSFAGYSLFTCDGGAYSGNILAPDKEIERFLSLYIDVNVLECVKKFLCKELALFLAPIGYEGFLGVDMLIYRDEKEIYRLYPCVEINLRMNMGAVSRIFYDKFVKEGMLGRYFVKHYNSSGEALAEYERISNLYPARVIDGRLVSGALYLSPVTMDSRYAAFTIIEEEADILSLYL